MCDEATTEQMDSILNFCLCTKQFKTIEVQNQGKPILFWNHKEFGVNNPGTIPARAQGLSLPGAADPALPCTGPKGAMAEAEDWRGRISLVDNKEIISCSQAQPVHGPIYII